VLALSLLPCRTRMYNGRHPEELEGQISPSGGETADILYMFIRISE
jgi:hypothetical protein